MPSSRWAASSSHRTPESRSIAARSRGCSTGDPFDATSTFPSDGAPDSSPRITSSSDTPSSVTIRYSVPTDGRDCPLSSWEIRLADKPSRRASSRWLIPAFTRSSRRRSPMRSRACGSPAAVVVTSAITSTSSHRRRRAPRRSSPDSRAGTPWRRRPRSSWRAGPSGSAPRRASSGLPSQNGLSPTMPGWIALIRMGASWIASVRIMRADPAVHRGDRGRPRIRTVLRAAAEQHDRRIVGQPVQQRVHGLGVAHELHRDEVDRAVRCRTRGSGCCRGRSPRARAARPARRRRARPRSSRGGSDGSRAR